MGIIISSFVGCGKHYMMSNNEKGIKLVDMDSVGDFGNVDEYVKRAVELSADNDIVFVSASDEVRACLDEFGVDFDVFYPSKDRRIEFIENQVHKRTKGNLIAELDHNFDKMVDDIDACHYKTQHNHKLEGFGEFLGNNKLIVRYLDTIDAKE